MIKTGDKIRFYSKDKGVLTYEVGEFRIEVVEGVAWDAIVDLVAESGKIESHLVSDVIYLFQQSYCWPPSHDDFMRQLWAGRKVTLPEFK